LLNLKRLEEAKSELEAAVLAGNPDLPMARWKLAAVHIAFEQPDPALQLLLPMEQSFAGQYEVVGGLGFAFYLKGEYRKAVEYLERAMTLRPPDALLLNALGYSHLQLGNTERARGAFERSLQMEPGQSEVERLLASVGESR
ncbi:MAG: tetratricopeptide repeat protein, partial [Vicinamibacteria bacterium]